MRGHTNIFYVFNAAEAGYLCTAKLSNKAILLWMYLSMFDDGKGTDVSYRRMSEHIGVHNKNLPHILKILEKHGAIKWTKFANKSRYVVNTPGYDDRLIKRTIRNKDGEHIARFIITESDIKTIAESGVSALAIKALIVIWITLSHLKTIAGNDVSFSTIRTLFIVLLQASQDSESDVIWRYIKSYLNGRLARKPVFMEAINELVEKNILKDVYKSSNKIAIEDVDKLIGMTLNSI